MNSKDILNLLESKAKKFKKKKEQQKSTKSKYIAIVDDATGEVEGYFQLQPKYLSEGGEFMAMFQQSADWISRQDLTGEQFKVLMQLISKVDYDNWIKVSQKEISNNTGIPRPNVSRAIKKLLECDIIQESPMRAGLNKCYRLNPLVGHKGRNFKQTVIDYAELKHKKKIRLEELEEIPTPFDIPTNIDPETGEILS